MGPTATGLTTAFTMGVDIATGIATGIAMGPRRIQLTKLMHLSKPLWLRWPRMRQHRWLLEHSLLQRPSVAASAASAASVYASSASAWLKRKKQSAGKAKAIRVLNGSALRCGSLLQNETYSVCFRPKDLMIMISHVLLFGSPFSPSLNTGKGLCFKTAALNLLNS